MTSAPMLRWTQARPSYYLVIGDAVVDEVTYEDIVKSPLATITRLLGAVHSHAQEQEA